MAKGPGGREVGRVSIRVVPDTSRFRSSLRRQLEQATAGFRAEVPVRVDVKDAQAAAKRLSNAFNGVDFGDAVNYNLRRTEVLIGNVVARTSEMARRLRESTKSMVNFTKRAVNVRAHFQRIGTTLSKIPRSIRAIKMRGLWENLVRSGDAALRLADSVRAVGRGFKRISVSGLSKLKESLKDTTKTANQASRTFLGLTRVGWIMVAVFSLATPLVGLIAGLLAGLPSLLAAAGAAGAALALGWDGIKDAASGLRDEVDSLKRALSGTFRTELTPVFEQLGKVFPVLEEGLVKVAKGLTPLAQGFADVVTSSEGMALIERTLENTSRLFASLRPMIESGTRAFLKLAAAGSDSFGYLADTLNTFARNFEAMVDRVTSSGVFDKAMRSLSQVTSALLDLFVVLMETGLESLAALGGPMTKFIDGFATAWKALAPVLDIIAALMFNVAGTLLEALSPAIVALTPFIEDLADVIGTALTSALEVLSPMLTSLAELLADHGSWLAPAVAAVWALQKAFVALNLVMRVNPFIAIATAVITIVVLIVDNWEYIVQFLSDTWNWISTTASTIWNGIKTFFSNLLTGIKVVFTTTWQQISNFVSGIWGWLSSTASSIWNGIKNTVTTVTSSISGFVRSAWNGLKNAVVSAWNGIKNGVRNGITAVLGFVRDLPGRIVRALGNLGRLLWNAGKSIINGLWEGMKSAVGAVFDWVGGLAGKIASLKGPLPYDRRLLIPAGRAIMAGLHEGLETGFDPVQRLVASMAPQLATAFQGQDIASAWADAIESGTPDALRAVERLMDKANRTATAEWSGHVSADEFGSIGDRVAEALAGWSLQMDPNGMLRLVEKARTRKARRG